MKESADAVTRRDFGKTMLAGSGVCPLCPTAGTNHKKSLFDRAEIFNLLNHLNFAV